MIAFTGRGPTFAENRIVCLARRRYEASTVKKAAARLRSHSAKVHNGGMIDWNDLKYLLAVARAGSTLAAAKSLRVNQSTVHRRLQELEKRLGCELVKRHSTGYRLTELGEHVCGYVSRIEEAVGDLERSVSASSKEPKGTVKVTCPEALGPRLIGARLIEKFHARYPHVRVEFVMSDKILNLGSDADIAIRAKRPSENSLFGRKIGDSPWAIYASRTYAERYGKVGNPAAINDHSVVMFAGTLSDHPAARWLKSVAPKAYVAARADNLAALLLSVKSGAGVAPMPVIVGENETDLVRVFEIKPMISTPFHLLIHQDMRRTPRVRAFFDFITENLEAIRPLLAPSERRPLKGRRKPLRRSSSR
jgi:DNA-binding transcriptional LysR family regulator